MTLPIISARGVGKRYNLGRLQKRNTSFRESIVEAIRTPFRRGGTTGTAGEEFWALRNIDFDVQPGDVLGVIGRNGAGKSTLLKVLSRITDPTEGRIEMRGRAASLLEVGTGFHPELTGRENIYLNGTILGMRKREIDRKFDEIVAFAEVERFIDTPVKRYSSGMYVRLAFGVAAHLDPEILIVDEVLAVGDAEFQRKCLNKMSDVAQGGRTVLFVSHNMAAVRSICSKALMLSRGQVAGIGEVDPIVNMYLQAGGSSAAAQLSFPLRGDHRPQFTALGMSTPTIEYGESIDLDVEIQSEIASTVAIELEIHDERGTPIAYMATAPIDKTLITLAAGTPRRVRLRCGPLPLATGRYDVYFWLIRPWAEDYHIPAEALSFEVIHSDPGESGFDFRQSYGRGATTFPLHVADA